MKLMRKRRLRIQLSEGGLEMLYKTLCKHQEKYMKPTNPQDWSWADCTDCTLGMIPWQPPLGFVKNICFLIWHDKVLDKILK